MNTRYLIEDDLGMRTWSDDPDEIVEAFTRGGLLELDGLGMVTRVTEPPFDGPRTE